MNDMGGRTPAHGASPGHAHPAPAAGEGHARPAPETASGRAQPAPGSGPEHAQPTPGTDPEHARSAADSASGHARPAADTASGDARPAPGADPGDGRAWAELRDGEAVRRFVEDFASALVEMGVPRMPARVFVALLTSDPGRLTAAEVGERLQASPAAVSGAVRYLTQIGLIRRETEPGSRRHYYRVPDDVWDELITLRNRAMARWTAVLREGVPVLGAQTPAGARLAESVRYFEFVSGELPNVIRRWREHKTALDGHAARER